MSLRISLLFLSSFFLAMPVASAKIYKCLDAQGKVFYSQSFNPKLCGGGGMQLNDQGLPVKQLQRQKTAEEIRLEQEQAQRDAEAKKIEDAQKQQDNALMMSYNTEADLLRARDQELEVINAGMNTTKLSLASQDKALADLLAHAASFERAKKSVPQVTVDQLKLVRKQIETINRQLSGRTAELERVKASYQAKLERYRELKANIEAQRSP